jgi:hypothetical protein
MARLDAITQGLTALDGKITAHLDADGAAVQALLAQNAALQQQVIDLTAQLDPAALDAEIAAANVRIEALGARL